MIRVQDRALRKAEILMQRGGFCTASTASSGKDGRTAALPPDCGTGGFTHDSAAAERGLMSRVQQSRVWVVCLPQALVQPHPEAAYWGALLSQHVCMHVEQNGWSCPGWRWCLQGRKQSVCRAACLVFSHGKQCKEVTFQGFVNSWEQTVKIASDHQQLGAQQVPQLCYMPQGLGGFCAHHDVSSHWCNWAGSALQPVGNHWKSNNLQASYTAR